MAHLIKTEAEIANEIRRRAQAKANKKLDLMAIRLPGIYRLKEPGPVGCWWSLSTVGTQGQRYVEQAAAEVANIWRLGPEG